MKMKWTKAQEAAINIRDCNILVSAAAGSGKTAVLVERIIKRILDADNPVNVDEILVMTFTKAAAAQMKERILQRLEDELKDGSLDAAARNRIKRQAALIDYAKISTIDSFCMNIIKENIIESGLDASFRVGSEKDLSLMRADILEELLEEEYDLANDDFIDFVNSYSKVRTDKKIIDYIENIYKFSCSVPWQEEWFENILTEGKNTAKEDYIEYILKEIKFTLSQIIEDIDRAISICNEDSGPLGYLSTFISEREIIKNIIAADDFFELSKRLSRFEFVNIGRVSKDTDPVLKDIAKKIRDDYKKLIQDKLIKYFVCDRERIESEDKCQKKTIKTLVRLTKEFNTRFSAAKADNNIVDFNDLEHIALKILWRSIGEKSEIAIAYTKHFKEIYVDEYQDSNYVQEEILKAIANNNVFMVGDVKQSIYGFRQARPELFTDKYDIYSDYEDEITENTKIILSKNYRSRKTVLESVNSVFKRIMGKDIGQIEYDDNAALYNGAVFEDISIGGRESAKKTELIIANSKDEELEENSKEIEAYVVAKRIKELMSEEGLLVKDAKNGEFRKLKYSDIVILLRSQKEWAQTFSEVLSREGIPAYAQSSTGYFSTFEIKKILSTLTTIDNPYQDIDLAAFLKSPIIDISDRELSDIVFFYKKGLSKENIFRLYDALIYCIQNEDSFIMAGLRQKLIRAEEFLDKYRRKSKYMGIDSIILDIYETTGYLDYISAMPAGEIRRANLLMLVEEAANYESIGYKGLFNFIRYIENIKKYDTDFGEAQVSGENDDIVRIMTIHKSKGLEFPVCFLSGMNKKFNEMDIREAVIIDTKLGPACDYVDLENNIRDDTIKKNAIKFRKRDENLAEELRVLYVAMTRAKELLIMTATAGGVDDIASKYDYIDSEMEGCIRSNELRKAKTYLDLVLMSLSSSSKDILIKIQKTSELIIKEEKRQNKISDMLNMFSDIDKINDKNLFEHIYKDYEFSEDVDLSAKLSISELKQLGQLIDESKTDIRYLKNKRNTLNKTEINNAERGTIYHRLMQILDYKSISDKLEIKELFNTILEKGYLSSKELSMVDEKDIINFIESDLGAEFKKAALRDSLKREIQFIMGIPANEIGVSQSSEDVLIQGIIDAYIEEEDGIILVDYKTDKVEDEQVFKKRYNIQLEYYKRAIEMMTEKRVKQTIIWSFYLNKPIYL